MGTQGITLVYPGQKINITYPTGVPIGHVFMYFQCFEFIVWLECLADYYEICD